MPRPPVAVLVAAAVLAPAPAAAWNKAGHQVTAAIAYDVLARDHPAVLARTLDVLRAHPSYERLWKPKLADVPAADRDVYLFMLAARWSDDIRGEKEFDRPTWHYIGTGFVAPDQPASVTLPAVPEPNAVTAIRDNVKLLTAADPADRAVAATWVFHLVGDIQQPLHATSRVTAAMPEGDRGGNRFWIRPTPTARPINLHAFWDDFIIGSERFRDARNRATELRLRPEFAKDKLAELADADPAAWAAESLKLGFEVVHQRGTLAGGSGELSAVPLPDGYIRATRPVAERRAVLAGYRLAQVLTAALDRPAAAVAPKIVIREQ